MDTRERLLAAARDLLLDQGLSGFSMRKVASTCGLSATAIYRHFQDKDALVSAAVEEGYRVFTRYLEAALEEPAPLARFRHTGQRYFDFARENPRYYALIFMTPGEELGLLKLHADAQREGAASFQFLVDRVIECQEAGLFWPGDPRGHAACVWASVHGLASLALQGRMTPDPADVLALEQLQLDAILGAFLRPEHRDLAAPPVKPLEPTPKDHNAQESTSCRDFSTEK